MDAKELRIGNIANSPYGECEIYGLSKDCVQITIPNNDSVFSVFDFDDDDIQPVLLTEEWLLKFGFEEDNVWVHKTKNISHNRMIGIDLPNNHVFLSQCDHHKHFRDVFIIKCDHVHQLQNLYFSLTGEELTIK